MRRGSAVVGLLLVAVLAWGSLVEPRFLLDVREERGVVTGLPDAWEGREVALLADFQVGMWGGNDGMIRRVVQDILERAPEAVLIAGDFVYGPGKNPEDEARRAMELLAPLTEAEIPVLAVLGNHDWAVAEPQDVPREESAAAVRRALEEHGATLLENETAEIPGDPGGLVVVGIGSEWAGTARPAESVAGLAPGTPRIVLMHNPDSFEGLPAGTAPLSLAGHTHGGQVRLPGTPTWSWLSFFKGDEVHADGWIEGTEGEGAPTGNQLYVNRGIGFSALPLRINARPELTYFTLTAGPASRNPGSGG